MSLHWLIGLLIIGQLVVGLVMVRMADQRLVFDLIQWHKSFGFLLLALALLRLVWRLANPTPQLPASMPAWEAKAAKASHGLLYVAMLAMPLSGWALVSASVLAIPTFAFYLVIIPHLPLTPSDGLELFWSWTHALLAYAIIALVVLHAIAALRHHFILRDDVLKRMLPPGKRTRKPGVDE